MDLIHGKCMKVVAHPANKGQEKESTCWGGRAKKRDVKVARYSAQTDKEKEEMEEYLARKDLTMHEVHHANSPSADRSNTLCEYQGLFFFHF